MKSLASPSPRVVLEKHWDREHGFAHKVEACFLRPKRVVDFRFLNLVRFLQQSNKHMKPVICLSSKSQTELEIGDDQIEETYNTKTIRVKFQLQKECSFGQHFLIVGDDPIFGLWDPSGAIPMNWSDGNVWSVEMDIPVGKSIQFKFILKESTGNVLWQPGPDRIFQTWETKNTITVCEDWTDAELQKIIEEDNVSNQIEGSNVNSDMLIVTKNLTYPTEEAAFDITKDPAIDLAETPLVEEPWKEQIVSEHLSPSQEKPKTSLAENITPKWPKTFAGPSEELITATTKVLNEEMLVADNIFGNNGRGATVMNLATMEGSLLNYEEGPVVVPGLTSSPAIPTEEAANKEEVKDLNMPELDVKQEPCSEIPQVETADMVNDNEQDCDAELKQTLHPAKEAEPVGIESVNGNVLQNDPLQEEATSVINDNVQNFDRELKQMSEPAQDVEHLNSEPINGNVLEDDPLQAEATAMINDHVQNFYEELKQTPQPSKETEPSNSNPIIGNVSQNATLQAEAIAMINDSAQDFDEELTQTPHPAEKVEPSYSEPINGNSALLNDPLHAEATVMVKDNGENSDYELKPTPQPAKEVEYSNSEATSGNFLQNDPLPDEASAVINDNVQNFDDELKKMLDPAEEAVHSNSVPINCNAFQNDPLKAETNALINDNKENSENELIEPPKPAREAEYSNSEPIKGNVLHIDPPQADATAMINKENSDNVYQPAKEPENFNSQPINQNHLQIDPPQAEATAMINKEDSDNVSQPAKEPENSNSNPINEDPLQIDPTPAEATTMISDNKENSDNELNEPPQPAKEEEHSNSEPVNGNILQIDDEATVTINDMKENSNFTQQSRSTFAQQSNLEPVDEDILHNDMQWGRKMLQKLMNKFRLPWTLQKNW